MRNRRKPRGIITLQPRHRALAASLVLLLALPGCEGYGRAEDGTVYYRESVGGGSTRRLPMPDADPDTFRTLRGKYARDRQRVYYRSKVVEGAQPGFIRVLGDGYARDRTGVYCAGRRIEQADWRTFEVLNAIYARDRHHVHVCTATLDNVHLPSFHLLQHASGAMDRESVFHRQERIDVCQRATFREIDWQWQTDDLCVYRLLERQPMIDAATFKVLGTEYVRDRLHVYTVDMTGRAVVVEGADPATFRERPRPGDPGSVYGRDASGCYASVNRVPCSVFTERFEPESAGSGSR